MNTKLASEKESFDFFLADTVIRSYESNDWISQEIDNLDDDIKNDLSNVSLPTREAFKLVYQKMVSNLLENVKISNNDAHLRVTSILFHKKFGWVLSALNKNSDIENKIFLGKLSLLEGTKIVMGRKTYISGPSVIKGGGMFKVGSFCAIAANLFVSTTIETHPMQYAAMIGRNGNPRFDEDWIDESFQHTEAMGHSESAIIGSDVWIGRNVTISSGVVIGDGCVIGQGSLVRDNCEPYGIYAGYPAKLKGYRFSEKHINQLLDIKWWNWPMDLMKKNSVFFNTNLKFFKGNIKDLLA